MYHGHTCGMTMGAVAVVVALEEEMRRFGVECGSLQPPAGH